MAKRSDRKTTSVGLKHYRTQKSAVMKRRGYRGNGKRATEEEESRNTRYTGVTMQVRPGRASSITGDPPRRQVRYERHRHRHRHRHRQTR